MAKMYITFKILPESPDIDLEKLKEKIKDQVEKLNGKYQSSDVEPIAFGLKALKLTFMFDESISTDPVEEKISENEEVSSVSVIDMRRAFG